MIVDQMGKLKLTKKWLWTAKIVRIRIKVICPLIKDSVKTDLKVAVEEI